ncbi:hypothetical protein RFL03_04550 [Streptococcus parasuis]|uniref:hypothetical protein n=1 Tax=Streptococcus parasuis TaxID=1501662 RepID=UPI002FC5F977
MTRTLEQINTELTKLITDNQKAIEKIESDLSALDPTIEKTKQDISRAKKDINAEAYDTAKRELWTAENTKEMLADRLQELKNEPLITKDDYKIMVENIKAAAEIEEGIIRKQALTYIKKLKELADESESVLKSANKNLTLLQYELYKDAEKTILSNGNVVTRPEKYTPLGTIIEFYRRFIKGTFLERKVD